MMMMSRDIGRGVWEAFDIHFALELFIHVIYTRKIKKIESGVFWIIFLRKMLSLIVKDLYKHSAYTNCVYRTLSVLFTCIKILAINFSPWRMISIFLISDLLSNLILITFKRTSITGDILVKNISEELYIENIIPVLKEMAFYQFTLFLYIIKYVSIFKFRQTQWLTVLLM